MVFEFSITDKVLTPIRPHKVEQLFSPKFLTPTRVRASDQTYRIYQSPEAPQVKDDLILNTPTGQTYFPRQSTGIKAQPADTFLKHGPMNEVSAALSGDTNNVTAEESVKKEAIPKYMPVTSIQEDRPVRATCFHPSGDVYVVGTNTKCLRLCAYPDQEELKYFDPEQPVAEPDVHYTISLVHQGSVYCSKFNDAGDLFASASNDQTVLVLKYDPEKHLPGKHEYKLTMHNGTVRDICFLASPGEQDTQYMLSAGAGDFKTYVTDCKVMRPVSAFQGHEATVMSLHCWNDPNLFVSGSQDRRIKLWDIRSSHCVATINDSSEQQNMAPIGAVRVDPTGRLLVSGHSDGDCIFHDLRGRREIQRFKAHEDDIRTVNFSPKTYYLLTAGFDGKVKLIDLQGDLTRPLPMVEILELSDKVVQTAWHPSHYNFITTCADGTATLWAVPDL